VVNQQRIQRRKLRPVEDVAAVKQSLEEANARFLDILTKGDAATAATNYAEDAMIMMPNAPAWQESRNR
jgi:ketosteroid isomerase-like protein